MKNIIDTNPNKIIVAGVIIILIFFGGMGAWAAFFPFHGAVIAPGSVKVSQERQTVQHLEGGIVEEILVREGDSVKAGDVLIRLRSSQVMAQVSLIQGQIWGKVAQAARLRAEIRMDDSITWPDELIENKKSIEVNDVMAKEEEIFHFRRTDLMGKISLYEAQIRQLNEQIAGAREELHAQERIISALGEEIEAKQKLLEGRYIDMTQVLELRRRLAEHEGLKGRLRQTIAEAGQRIEELNLRKVDLKNTYKDHAAKSLGETSDEIFTLRERLRPAMDARMRLEIIAPIDGEILNMRVHSEESGVIRSGEPIMDIVPINAELIVEGRIQPQNITKVHQGQEAKVHLTAFNRRDVPPLKGEVVHVSADKLEEQSSMGLHAYYITYVRVEQEELEQYNVYMSPGMPVVSYITTEKRTILAYLLDPVLDVLDRSMRE
jgi:HlyD family type I secretion membrane fusion protein